MIKDLADNSTDSVHTVKCPLGFSIHESPPVQLGQNIYSSKILWYVVLSFFHSFMWKLQKTNKCIGLHKCKGRHDIRNIQNFCTR